MNEIVNVVLIDGTKFAVGEFRFGGTIKSITQINELTIMIRVTSNKVIAIPYHSVLFLIIEE